MARKGVRLDDENVAADLVDHALGGAADEQALQAGARHGAHDQQVARQAPGQPWQHRRRTPCLDRNAPPPGSLALREAIHCLPHRGV
jgi:hypothetical protein